MTKANYQSKRSAYWREVNKLDRTIFGRALTASHDEDQSPKSRSFHTAELLWEHNSATVKYNTAYVRRLKLSGYSAVESCLVITQPGFPPDNQVAVRLATKYVYSSSGRFVPVLHWNPNGKSGCLQLPTEEIYQQLLIELQHGETVTRHLQETNTK